MLARREIFPHVIEMNYQARRRLGCCVYLVHDESEWLLIDIGYTDTVTEIVDMVRQMDFSLSHCKYLVATHADVDHIQGLKKAKELLPRAIAVGHPETRRLLSDVDRVMTYAEISAQRDLDRAPEHSARSHHRRRRPLTIGKRSLEVWHTPGHTHGQLSFRMGDLLFSADNIYRDGCVGNIDAHHGSDIPAFIKSLERIRDSDVKWLLPSHGPVFRKDNVLIEATLHRLRGYQHMADFGTCAVDWPLLDEWDEELARGDVPTKAG